MRSGEWNPPGGDGGDDPVAGDAAGTAALPPSLLRRVVAILESFDPEAPRLSLAELARRSALPKATAHRLAHQMVAERLLSRDEEGRFALGVRLFEFGGMVPVARSLSSLALPIMEDLREATRLRVHLAILEGVDVVYVEILGATAAAVGSRTGGRYPAHATGVGKVMLAYSPAATVRARIEAGLPALTPFTITAGAGLVEELREIRAVGMALDRQESHLGSSCVAAPVFGAGRRIRAGLSVTGPTTGVDPVHVGPAVRTAAFILSRALRNAAL